MKIRSLIFLLAIHSYAISQVDTSFYKDSKLSKSTYKNKAKYLVIKSVKGVMTEIRTINLKKDKLIRAILYKTDDSLHYNRTTEYFKVLKVVSTVEDSTIEIKNYSLENDSLIGIVKYQTILSKRDSNKLNRLKNIIIGQDNNASSILLPVFHDKINFNDYLLRSVVPPNDPEFSLNLHDKTKIFELYFRIDLDIDGNVTNLVLLEKDNEALDKACYTTASKISRWAKPAYKSGKPISYSYYSKIKYIIFPPLIILDTGN